MKFALLALVACLPAMAVDVRLVNSRTGETVANADVRVFSDNGIRCIKAPCPTNSRQWSGRSDALGKVQVPESAFNSDTRFEVPGFEGTTSIPRDAATSASWTVELDPKGAGIEEGMRVDRVKLTDKATGKPLANVAFWIATSRGCGSRSCAVLSGSTNVLGNAFVALARIPDLDKTLWIGAEGHKTVEYQPSQALILPLPR